MLANIVGTRILMRKSPLTSFKELSIKMRIGLISLIVLLILPASYSAVTLTIEQARKRRDQTVCRKRVRQLYGY